MPTYEFVTVDVFTEQRFGGNPLAVFPDARGLHDADMQAIAAEFNLSETTFVLPPDNPQHHARVRIFTPQAELPFAGHPNVGTGYVLAQRDDNPPEHYVFEEPAGLVRVHVLRGPGKAITGTRISAPRSLSIDIGIPDDVIARCIGLDGSDVLTTAHTPLVASVGTPFVIAELRSVEALSAASPDLAAFRDGGRAVLRRRNPTSPCTSMPGSTATPPTCAPACSPRSAASWRTPPPAAPTPPWPRCSPRWRRVATSTLPTRSSRAWRWAGPAGSSPPRARRPRARCWPPCRGAACRCCKGH